MRYGARPALDQHALKSALGQRPQDLRRGDQALLPRQAHYLDIGRQGWTSAGPGNYQPPYAVARKYTGAGRQPSTGIDDHPCRLRPGYVPNRKLRVVGEGGTHPDHNRINQRAQPMQMGKPIRSIDVMGVTGRGRHPAIQRLADLTYHHQIVGAADP
jgi:hypothetical protein